MATVGREARQLAQEDSFAGALAVIERFYQEGWTDGLPVVPPHQELVRAMVAASGRNRTEIVGKVPPRMGVATVEAVATNAVMAGCRPEYMPVVLASLEAALDERFGLREVQTTTDPSAPLIMVSGPVVRQLAVNHGVNVFGHGFRANATIGRALRLIMVNLGGGHPDSGDKSTLGSPAKFSFCIGVDQESPWEPLHVERGFRPEENCVTLFPCEPPHDIHVPTGSGMGETSLQVIAESMAAIGTGNMIMGGQSLLVLGPMVAHALASDGWAKQDVKQYIFEHSRLPITKLWWYHEARFGKRPAASTPDHWPKWLDVANPAATVPIVRRPENLHVVVAGDVGRPRCAVCSGRPYNFAVTRAVTPP